MRSVFRRIASPISRDNNNNSNDNTTADSASTVENKDRSYFFSLPLSHSKSANVIKTEKQQAQQQQQQQAQQQVKPRRRGQSLDFVPTKNLVLQDGIPKGGITNDSNEIDREQDQDQTPIASVNGFTNVEDYTKDNEYDDEDDEDEDDLLSTDPSVEAYVGSGLEPEDNDVPVSAPESSSSAGIKRKTSRNYSATDANSIIGGSSVGFTKSNENNNAQEFRAEKPEQGSSSSSPPPDEVTTVEPSISKSHKIFSFQLPFGGTLSFPKRHMKIPFMNSSAASGNEELDEELRLKLERNESITTLEEAKIFARYKGVDNARLRAVRKAFTPSIGNYLSNSTTRPDYETIYDTLEGDIVVLGGYRGSILRDAKTLKRIWIPIKAGFNLRKIDLYIGPTAEDELKQESKIIPDGMLTHIGPIDIGRKLLKRLKMNPNLRVHEFSYDWRLSGAYNSAKLFEFLQKIYNTQTTKKGSYVLAHSMGGLIAHHVMNRNPDLIRGMVYLGVPSECPNVLGPVRFGDDVLLSKEILTAEVNFMMRSSFLFMPLSGELFVHRESHEKILLDYFDVDTWIKYNLSPLVGLNRLQFEKDLEQGKIKDLEQYERHGGTVNTYNNAVHPVIAENLTAFKTSYKDSVEYLDRTLKQTKKFLLELEHNPDLKYPPLVSVYGNTIPSLRGSFISNEDDIKEGNWFNFFYGPGDGVVNQHWIMPLKKKGFDVVAKYESNCGHVALMTDLDNIGRALRSLVEAEAAAMPNKASA